MKARILLTTLALACCGTARADDWTWFVTPYVWATDVGLDLSLHDRSLVDATIPFDDLVEDLESAVLIRASAMHGAHGLAVDVFDVVTADDSGTIAVPGHPDTTAALNAKVGLTLVDLTGVYDPAGDGTGLAFVYGTRVINQRANLHASVAVGSTPGPSVQHDDSDTFIDALIGVRYEHRFGDRWSCGLAADVSTGGTDLTWSVGPTVGYRFGARHQYRLDAGYRRMVIEFDTRPGIDSSMTLSGALVGLRFEF